MAESSQSSDSRQRSIGSSYCTQRQIYQYSIFNTLICKVLVQDLCAAECSLVCRDRRAQKFAPSTAASASATAFKGLSEQKQKRLARALDSSAH